MMRDKNVLYMSFDNVNFSFLFGFLISIPFPYPAAPYYFFSFIYLLYLAICQLKKDLISPLISVALLFYVLSAVLSSIVNISYVEMTINPIIGYLITAAIIFCSQFEKDPDMFFNGFVAGAKFISIAIIFMFFFDGHANDYLLTFVSVEGRMWGASFFPDWPNYIAIIPLIAAIYIYARCGKFSYWILVFLLASILTTSRISLLGCAVIFLMCLLNSRKFLSIFVVLLAPFFLLAWNFPDLDSQLLTRLTKVSDRELLMKNLLSAWFDSPFFGWGAVSVSEVVSDSSYHSFHNSFLESLVRTGVVGTTVYFFILVILLFQLIVKCRTSQYFNFKFLFLLLFLIIASLAQNYLKHPHIMFVFAVLCLSRQEIFRDSNNDQ